MACNDTEFDEWKEKLKGLLEEFWVREEDEDGEELVSLSYYFNFYEGVYKVTYTREAPTETERFKFERINNEDEALKYDKQSF